MFPKAVFDLAYAYFKSERKTSQTFTNEIGISLPSLKKYTEEPIREGRLIGDKNSTPQAIDPKVIIKNLLSVTKVVQVKDSSIDTVERLVTLSNDLNEIKKKIASIEEEIERVRSEISGRTWC